MKNRLLSLLILLLPLAASAQPLGELTRDLHAREAYAGQSAYMDFYHALALERDNVDISLSALLSIGGTVSGGRIFEESIGQLYPFQNSIVVLKMSGQEIKDYLEASYAQWVGTVSSPEEPVLLLKSSTDSKGKVKWNFRNTPANFDSAGGLIYTVDVTRPAGEKVSIRSLSDGRPFEASARYNVAITDYRARGTGKLLQSAGIDPKDMEDRIVERGPRFTDILKERLSRQPVIDPDHLETGSWKFLPEGWAAAGIRRDLALIFGETPYDTRSEIMANPQKAGGEYYLYEMDLPEPTPAPKGYKPFYISHFGRHGARYALGERVYEELRDLLAQAHTDGVLNEKGEDLYRRYEAFYPRVAYRGGLLTEKGQEQLRALADRAYADYPAVFKGKTRAKVISTESHRVLVSMMSFLDELRQKDEDLTFEMDYGRPYLPVLEPSKSTSPEYVAGKPLSPSLARKVERFGRRVDVDLLSERFFRNPEWLEAHGGKAAFIESLKTVVVDLPCLDDPGTDDFSDLFTAEELYRMWQVRNYRGYLAFGNAPGTDAQRCREMAGTVRDVIEKAEEDWKDGTALRLRFSHDTGLMPLLSYLEINHFGDRVEEPFEVENHWRSFEIPMAGNLQLIFFRSRKGGDILVKALLNGREAALPLTPVSGPYYRWDDFKAYYGAK